MKDKIQGQIKIPKWKGTQRRIGLTGGIASGKSSISKFLNCTMQIPILDADIYAHEALTDNSNTAEIIIQHFGNKIIKKNKNNLSIIDRKMLGNIIFGDKKERSWIENILHPIIINRIEKELEKVKEFDNIVIMIPLLFESNLSYLCSEIWVVSCTEKQQYSRLMKRDNINIYQARNLIESQLSLTEKIKLADIIVDNSGPINSWQNQIKKLIY